MKIDKGTLLGIVLAVGGIAGGLVLEGGSLLEILQPTAALIVFGGTFGATLLAQPMSLCIGACRQLLKIFHEADQNYDAIIESIIGLSNDARRSGIISLEKKLSQISDRFLRKAVTLAVDGTEPRELREIMNMEIEQELARRHAEAGVFETAGGFAPTIGIIGAVLGLIQVMKHLDNIEEVGKGIAVAFVATIYGVGIANLLLLPAAKKIIVRAQQAATVSEIMLEGVISVTEGLNPRLIRCKLDGYLEPSAQTGAEGAAADREVQPAA